MVKNIHTTLDENIYNKIKKHGFKVNMLIQRGYECLTGRCITADALKNELDECKKKLSEIEIKNKAEIENLIKKHVDENTELKIIKTYLTILLQHLIDKYVKTREQLEIEINEAFDEEKKEKFLKLIRDRKVFIFLDK
ncbi:MAG: hypothetical protein QXJ14_02685 [Candidatus Aenigmatarchaeota archaeon]